MINNPALSRTSATCSRDKKPANAFTILEMMIVLLVITIMLFITLPNIQQKEKVIRGKGCSALIEIVNSQIMLYEVDEARTPTSVQQLIQKGYLKKEQAKCPDGKTVTIKDGEAQAG